MHLKCLLDTHAKRATHMEFIVVGDWYTYIYI